MSTSNKAHHFRLYVEEYNKEWKGHPGYQATPKDSHIAHFSSDASIDFAWAEMMTYFKPYIKSNHMWSIAILHDSFGVENPYWQNITWGEGILK